MNYKLASICLIIFFFISTFAHCSIADSDEFFPLYYVGGSGVGNFTSISEAISEAPANAQIKVFPGWYNESIDLYKPLHLTSVIPHEATLFYSGYDDTVEITADGCILEGFNITHNTGKGYTSISLTSDNNLIENNIFYKNPERGLYLFNCKHNIIKDNQFYSDGIIIVGDNSEWNTHIFLNNSVNNKDLLVLKNVSDYTISNKSYGQIILINCSKVRIHNCTIDNTDQGIVFGHCNLCSATYNTISHTLYAIHLSYSKNCSISSNMIQNNEYGIYIIHSNQNKIKNNTIDKQTEYGVYICCNSKYNILYQNKLVNNSKSAYDLFSNQWHFKNIGNYWSDYTGFDHDNNGIGDNDYEIDGNTSVDPYPLINSSFSITNQNESSKQTPVDSLAIFLVCIIFILYSRKIKY
jgi:parallel beta-helix repeat protein